MVICDGYRRQCLTQQEEDLEESLIDKHIVLKFELKQFSLKISYLVTSKVSPDIMNSTPPAPAAPTSEPSTATSDFSGSHVSRHRSGPNQDTLVTDMSIVDGAVVVDSGAKCNAVNDVRKANWNVSCVFNALHVEPGNCTDLIDLPKRRRLILAATAVLWQ